MELLTGAGRGQHMGTTESTGTGLVHEALFYLDADDYARSITRFVQEGLQMAQPALVAVPGLRVDELRSAMGRDAERVRFVDMAEVGRNPGRILPTVIHPFVAEHRPHRVRIVGEPFWPGRSAAEYRVALQHEALINIALANQEATILCPHDRQGLDAATLARARQTHPVLIDAAQQEASPDYDDPRAIADASLRSLPDPPDWWGDMLIFSSADGLPTIQRFVESRALRMGLRAERVADLCRAVNEVATNTLVHTSAAGVLSLWQDPDTGNLVCEIVDSGQLPNRLVGRIPPAPWEPHGHGLIQVNTLCDLVEIPTGQIGTGTTVRLHMRLS
ncbi:MAG: anti-sigma factor RsbA family regulatory protein [Pseudonocardiaceae bacterium]